MSRGIDLESYLPQYLRGYKEIAEALKAENPEFELVWENVERLLSNLFIDSADEYGISRMENLLKIIPSNKDTLESRRARVKSLWWNPTPYSVRAFVKKIEELCGEGNYTVDKTKLGEYYISLVTHLSQYGETDSLKRIVTSMVPDNMVVDVLNEIVTMTCAAIAYAGTVITQGSCQKLDNDIRGDEDMYMNHPVLVASLGEVYENCEGSTGQAFAVGMEPEPLGVGIALGQDMHGMIQEGGNRNQDLTAPVYVGAVITCATQTELEV